MLLSSKAIKLYLPVAPYGAARHRHRYVKPRGSQAGFIQTYDDTDYQKWRRDVAPFFNRARPRDPILGPVQLAMLAVMPFRAQDTRKTRYVPRKWHDVRPDIDNIQKSILDAATLAGWIHDDRQVVRVVAEKVYAAQGEEACVHVVISEVDPYHVR